MTREYNYAGGQNELVSYSKLANLEITKRHQEPPDGDQRKGEPDRQEAHRIHGRRCIEILAQDRQAAASETRVHALLVRCARPMSANDTSAATGAPRLSSVKST